MPFSVELSELALRQLRILGKAEAERIFAKLADAAADPNHYFKRLTGHEDFKLRVGDYRVVVRINKAKGRIFVRLIGHRKRVYKDLR